MSRRKNIYNLVTAYKRVKAQFPSLPKLLLVGKIAKYMTDITNEFDTNVVSIPFQDNYVIKSIVRNSRGLIFPSLYEGFGLPVIEAFSQGVGVACSNITSLPEIAAGRAILFNPNDVADMERAIIDLHHIEPHRTELRMYAAQFSYNRAAEEYMKLIKRDTKTHLLENKQITK